TAIPTGASPENMVAADLNGDNMPDLAFTDTASNTLYVMLATGPLAFAAPQTYPTGNAPYGLDVGDFDGDRLPDIPVAYSGALDVGIFTNAGGGAFTLRGAVTACPGTSTPTGPYALVARDFNGDGKSDLAVTCRSAGVVAVLLRK